MLRLRRGFGCHSRSGIFLCGVRVTKTFRTVLRYAGSSNSIVDPALTTPSSLCLSVLHPSCANLDPPSWDVHDWIRRGSDGTWMVSRAIASSRRVKVKAKKTGGYRHHNDILPERQRKPIYTRQRLRKTLLIRFWPKRKVATLASAAANPCIPPDPSGSHAEKCKHCSDNGAALQLQVDPRPTQSLRDAHPSPPPGRPLGHHPHLSCPRNEICYAQYNADEDARAHARSCISARRGTNRKTLRGRQVLRRREGVTPMFAPFDDLSPAAKLQFYTDVTSAVRTIFARFDRIAKTTRSDDEEHDVERSCLQSICEASGTGRRLQLEGQVSYQQSRLLSSACLRYMCLDIFPRLALTPRERQGKMRPSDRLGACHIANLNCRHRKGGHKEKKKGNMTPTRFERMTFGNFLE
ncbi:hypothetical protein L1887_48087 [Cichorium endivia]|nr:hypothetical protein L1887_48087 [Cichorium endivia]